MNSDVQRHDDLYEQDVASTHFPQTTEKWSKFKKWLCLSYWYCSGFGGTSTSDKATEDGHLLVVYLVRGRSISCVSISEN